MTMSPIYGETARPLPGAAAGNDSTLVGAFLPRQSRLSVRIAESSPSTIASSTGLVETASAAAEIARFTVVWAPRRFFQCAERTMTSVRTCFSLPRLRGRIGEGALLKAASRIKAPTRHAEPAVGP